MNNSRLVRGAAFAALAAALATVPALPSAVAATSTFQDTRLESASRSDLQWVQVTNSRQHDRFLVRAGLSDVVYGVGLTVYVDLARRNPGPELRMHADPDSEWALYAVDRFGERGDRIRICGRVQYSDSVEPIARWKTTRSCLGITGPVRVSVKVADRGHGVDWGPAAQTFYPWVSAKY